MEVPFSEQEVAAIEQLSKMLDVTPQKVVVQALRLYQLYQMNQIKIIFPRVIDCTFKVVPEPPINENVVVSPV